jgi:hypothetical protein
MDRHVSIPDTTLVRDLHSKALLEQNHKLVDEYTLRRKMFQDSRNSTERINNLEEKVNFLDKKIDLILTLLAGKELK